MYSNETLPGLHKAGIASICNRLNGEKARIYRPPAPPSANNVKADAAQEQVCPGGCHGAAGQGLDRGVLPDRDLATREKQVTTAVDESRNEAGKQGWAFP